MEVHGGSLPIPPDADASASAKELARVWVADGQQCVTLATGVWDDPAAWGIMLVDLSKHIAKAYLESGREDIDGILARIREGFDAEWEAPSDEMTGESRG